MSSRVRFELSRSCLVLLPLVGGGPATVPARPADLTGVVFLDQNGNGVRDVGETGIANVAVSDQVQVVATATDGSFRIPASTGFGVAYVTVPDGYRAVNGFWRATDAGGPIGFGLVPAAAPAEFTFVHASDTHISEASVARTQRLGALVDSVKPAFVLITGDLIRDALRVPEAEATSYFELFKRETGRFSVPVWNAPGNHDVFGIERQSSLVSPKHPLYARGMYHHYLGPDYYSFNFGGIHFVALNTVDIDDQRYYGHVDSVQIAWLARDLELVPKTTPVVTFNHIPFFTAVETVNGIMDGGPAPSVITVRGHTSFRHSVWNAGDIVTLLAGRPYPLALGGHMHVREKLRYEGVATRFYQSAAVIGPTVSSGLTFPSGIVVYRVRAGQIDDGQFVPLGLEGGAH
ncbi:MAG: metallophosphoesterase [Gemmatimonadota bacterium]